MTLLFLAGAEVKNENYFCATVCRKFSSSNCDFEDLIRVESIL